MRWNGVWTGFVCLVLTGVLVSGQKPEKATAKQLAGEPARPVRFETPEFRLELDGSSQVAVGLEGRNPGGFNFLPADRFPTRSGDGFHHLGDLTFRVATDGQWRQFSTAAARKPVGVLPSDPGVLAAADLSPTLPVDCPLRVLRRWEVRSGRLVLSFELRNEGRAAVRVGSLGIPLIFNNILTDRTLEEAHRHCSFSDPSISLEGGYLQVVPLSGDGPVLLAVPEGATPFEAFNPLSGDPTPRNQTFEGFYEWLVFSESHARQEWANAVPWNAPSGLTLEPGASRQVGLRFLLAPDLRSIERTLQENARPVAVGIPGYVLPMDVHARLFVRYHHSVRSIEVFPAGSLYVRELGPTAGGWGQLGIEGRRWGNSRLTLTYADGIRQTIHYRVIKAAAQAVDDMGRFLTTRQWFSDPEDPFGRSPSVISYDRRTDRQVLQDGRVWIAGLGDEGGSGSWLAAFMKQWGRPSREEVEKLEQFVDGVLWGRLQYAEGPNRYGVRKSLFYFAPERFPPGFYDPAFDWTTWASWSKDKSEAVDRSFNYPHVAAAYWVFYRLARNNEGLVQNHPWDWYLKQAFETSLAMTRFAPEYARFGQMEGDVFLAILQDLKREGLEEEAFELERTTRGRADVWNSEAYPFGSEMSWDSTGQEEVYAWSKYFGFEEKARVTLNAVLAYMPALPHWAYHGNARRYWDFLYAGEPGPASRIERQVHHYGSGINSIPVLTAFRENPEDLYLLRVGWGGSTGALTNIDVEGFASAAFHAWPSELRWNGYSGDYGPNFFGHAWTAGTYLVRHPEFGWLVFGGNLEVNGNRIRITPLDSFRSRLFIAPTGLWLTLDAGRVRAAEFDEEQGLLRVGLEPADAFTRYARLRIERPGNEGKVPFQISEDFPVDRGAFVVPLESGVRWVEIR